MKVSAILFILFGLGLILMTSSCGQQAQVASIEGVWSSIGYGRIAQIDANDYSLYDFTTISCLPVKEGNIEEFEEIKLLGDTLMVRLGYNEYYFERSDQFPDLCRQKLNNKKKQDPLYNFEVIAQNYKDHYTYFELNDINWEELYQATKAKISAQTSPAELYLILEEMIEQLNDGHGYLDVPEEIEDDADQLLETDLAEEEEEDLVEYGDFHIAQLVADHYLEEEMTQDSKMIKWGKMANNIGYIQVKAMMIHAKLNLDTASIRENGYYPSYFEALTELNDTEQFWAEVDGINLTLDQVMEDLKHTDAIILDLRFNGGGLDEVGLQITSRFNPKKQKFGSKKARNKNGFTKEIPLYLKASKEPYTKPLYLLTSQQSGSATEITVMSSLILPQAKRIGAHTMGATSDALAKVLPNGWEFSLSNEIYYDNQGIFYESKGIPVDIQLDYPLDRQTFFRSVANDLQADKDTILSTIGISKD